MLLNSYDLVLINSSAGKDSQAMLTYLVALADEQGLPREKLVVVHADLGRVEWDGTRDLAERQANFYGLRFEVVSREKGDLLAQVEERGMWPSSTTRYCTSDQKRDQIQKLITKESRAIGGQVRFLNCMGLRAEESPARAKAAALEVNKRASSKTRTVENWLPIQAWTTGDVWRTNVESGVEIHPVYRAGMNRLSCVFCIFASKKDLKIAGRLNPKLLAEYVALEAKIDHTFKANMAIAEVAAELADETALLAIDPVEAPVVSGVVDSRQCAYCQAIQGKKSSDLSELPPFGLCEGEEGECRCFLVGEGASTVEASQATASINSSIGGSCYALDWGAHCSA